MSDVYQPFSNFEIWSRVSVGGDRWQAVLGHVDELRGGNTGFEWLHGPLRAAAYQSGAIEGLHPGDRGLTLGLIKAVGEWHAAVRDAPDGGGPEVVDYIGAGVEALEMALDVATHSRPITQTWIREVHAMVCRPQQTYAVTDSLGTRSDRPLHKGAYKEHDNNVRLASGELLAFASPLDLPAEMERLVGELESPRFGSAHPIVQSSFAQQALTHIHPFADGNGRVARVMGSVFLLRAASLPFFLFVDDRNRYLDALAAADEGDVRMFVSFVLHRVEDLSAILVEQRRAAKPVTSGGPTLTTWRRQIDRAAAFARAVDRGVDRAERRHRIRPARSSSTFSEARERIASIGTVAGDLPKIPPLRREITIELGGVGVTETLTLVIDLETIGSHPFAVHAEESELALTARPAEVWPTPTTAFELRLDAWLDQVVRALAVRVNRQLGGAG